LPYVLPIRAVLNAQNTTIHWVVTVKTSEAHNQLPSTIFTTSFERARDPSDLSAHVAATRRFEFEI
jgi:hypothetical protein